MYTATADSLVLPLPIQELISEPENGRLFFTETKTAVFPAQTHYIYIPDPEFAGTDAFDFVDENGICNTAIIHVKETTFGGKVFIPFVQESVALV